MGFKILLAFLGLATAVFSWWVKVDFEKKQKRQKIDEEIDAIDNADDATRMADKLRDK
jgi:hypothetical protein